MSVTATDKHSHYAEEIRITGIVQGVGFRPTVWRLATEVGLRGHVLNDAAGVLIMACGSRDMIERFVQRLHSESPPLARIDSIRRSSLYDIDIPEAFVIDSSRSGVMQTQVSSDACTCAACLNDINDPSNRRYRYPFTNCTHCGPRMSIIRAIPYDRHNTSMSAFSLCKQCRDEYQDPTDRRFHAQPNACTDCGPQLWLSDRHGNVIDTTGSLDSIEAAAKLLQQGKIVAIKGIGGIHVACDAGNEQAVQTLRERKRRFDKPFALMASDCSMIGRYACMDDDTRALLLHRAAPIVLLQADGTTLASAIAPETHELGFMLPYSPLHHLLMQHLHRPIVLTSANPGDEPQCIENDEACQRLGSIVDFYLLHDRAIENRLDDSVIRMAAGKPRMLRRARGYVPESINLPDGCNDTPEYLAMGAELKNTFCLVKGGNAILSQHMGDLENAGVQKDYRKTLTLYRQLFQHEPEAIFVDLHPDYLSTQLGRAMAEQLDVACIEVQHHHAHIAACMAEHGLPLSCGPVLGIAMDGIGYGDDGSLWGGEFMLADYGGYQRLAHFDSIPMPGGSQCMREPWRNTLAQLNHYIHWNELQDLCAGTELIENLMAKPHGLIRQMINRGLNSPRASSCGRLFDAVAAALGIRYDSVSYEGQAAIALEAMASNTFAQQQQHPYPVDYLEQDRLVLGWSSLWHALLRDLRTGVDRDIIAARFHHAIAQAISSTALRLCGQYHLDIVVLGGGVFQNRLLLEQTIDLIQERGIEVLAPADVPANDGGISLGQALVGIARSGRCS